MANEDFSTYTEVDALARLTVTPPRVTWAGLLRGDPDIYVYFDKGINFFDGDFEHDITIEITAGNAGVWSAIWGMANILDDMFSIILGGEDALYVTHTIHAGPHAHIEFWEIDGGAAHTGGASIALTLNTPYYLTIVRDDDGGIGFGRLWGYIYDDPGRTNLIDTINRTLHTSQKDFRYIMLPVSYDDGAGIQSTSGYLENLDLKGEPTVQTLPATEVT